MLFGNGSVWPKKKQGKTITICVLVSLSVFKAFKYDNWWELNFDVVLLCQATHLQENKSRVTDVIM